MLRPFVKHEIGCRVQLKAINQRPAIATREESRVVHLTGWTEFLTGPAERRIRCCTDRLNPPRRTSLGSRCPVRAIEDHATKAGDMLQIEPVLEPLEGFLDAPALVTEVAEGAGGKARGVEGRNSWPLDSTGIRSMVDRALRPTSETLIHIHGCHHKSNTQPFQGELSWQQRKFCF
jgi:hypothetical protein